MVIDISNIPNWSKTQLIQKVVSKDLTLNILFTIIRRYVFCVTAPTPPKNEVINNTLPITIKRSGYFDISSAAMHINTHSGKSG